MDSPALANDTGQVSSTSGSPAMRKVVVVSNEQYDAARALVRISGGIDKVEPLIAKIAQAEPATAEQKRLACR